ncbi:MAG: YdeI/OmpD-associated family protein [Clostridium sp.]|nr:YdeI/OmpD-associated family protein [Clostridium sp.]MDU7083762.1 YdeI/OmpD-associated family protein [Clostridium sp.]
MERFNAEIKQVEGKDASYIEIPFDVEAVYGSKRVKVKATFDGHPYRGSIVRMGLPCYMIGITKEIRKAIGKTFGDIIQVSIEKDEEERTIEVPKDFQEAVDKSEEAKVFWDTLSFSGKRKYITWITSAKKEETRKQRVETAIEKLRNKEKL